MAVIFTGWNNHGSDTGLGRNPQPVLGIAVLGGGDHWREPGDLLVFFIVRIFLHIMRLTYLMHTGLFSLSWYPTH